MGAPSASRCAAWTGCARVEILIAVGLFLLHHLLLPHLLLIEALLVHVVGDGSILVVIIVIGRAGIAPPEGIVETRHRPTEIIAAARRNRSSCCGIRRFESGCRGNHCGPMAGARRRAGSNCVGTNRAGTTSLHSSRADTGVGRTAVRMAVSRTDPSRNVCRSQTCPLPLMWLPLKPLWPPLKLACPPEPPACGHRRRDLRHAAPTRGTARNRANAAMGTRRRI